MRESLTFRSDLKQCIQSGKHTLPALQPIPFQVRKLELQKSIKDLTLHQQLPDPSLLPIVPLTSRTCRRLQKIRNPKSLSLRDGMHVLIPDFTGIHFTHMIHDPFEWPELVGTILPDDTVDIVGGISLETVSGGV